MHPIIAVLYFFLIAFVAFYAPGYFFIRKLKLSFLDEIAASVVFGIVIWVFQAYLFGMFGLRDLTYLYLTVFAVLFVRGIKQYILKIPRSVRVNLPDFSVVTLGLFFLLSAVWFIGVKIDDGLFFCCRGVPDAIYHLSLTNQLIGSFPAEEPGMSGVLVKNYHFFSNLASADISRVFGTNLIDTQFRFMSTILAFLLLIFPFSFSRILSLGKTYARLLTLFIFSSGDILFVLLFLRGKGLDFGTTIVDDATKLLAGPPRAFSAVVIFWGIYFLAVWLKRKSWPAYFFSAVLFASLFGFKVYTGIFALAGLGALGFYYLTHRKFKELVPPLLALILSLVYHFQFNRGAGGLNFNGLWRFENFTQHKDLFISKLDYIRLQAADSNNLFVVGFLWTIIILAYFLFLFGIANFAFIQSKGSLKNIPKELIIFISVGIFSSMILGSFFLQETGGANTVQFLIGAYIIALLPAALGISYVFNVLRKPFSVLFLTIVVLFTSARGFHEVGQNVDMVLGKNSFTVNNNELEALTYLKNHTPEESIISVEPWAAEDQPFMYISFLSERKLFLLGGGVLRDHGHDISDRQRINKNIYSSADPTEVLSLARQNNINYILLTPGINLSAGQSDYLQEVYNKHEIRILRIL